nr:MAG TPA: hypothetical protein [Caudoviricetes sp.]
MDCPLNTFKRCILKNVCHLGVILTIKSVGSRLNTDFPRI